LAFPTEFSVVDITFVPNDNTQTASLIVLTATDAGRVIHFYSRTVTVNANQKYIASGQPIVLPSQLSDVESIYVNQFRSHIYVHVNSRVFRALLTSDLASTTVWEELCRNSYDEDYDHSHGMYVSVSGDIYVAHFNQVDPNETQAVVGQSGQSGCSEIIPYTQASLPVFDNFRYTAAEGCFISFDAPAPAPVSPPPRVPPPPVVQPPNPPQPVPPPPQGGTPVNGHSDNSHTIHKSDNEPLYNNYATGFIGLGSASAVGFFAIFAVVIGINNTKKNPPQPDLSVLVGEEANAVAHDNPVFEQIIGASENVLHGAS